MKFRYLIFDLDGTLVDSARELSESCNFVRHSFGLDSYPLETLRSFIGNGIRDLINKSLGDCGDLKEAERLFNEDYSKRLGSSVLYPGVLETLLDLKSLGYRLSIATNKMQVFSLKVLECLGLVELFDLVVGGDFLSSKKPAPDQLIHIMRYYENLERAPVADLTLMIGDSLNDSLSARAASIKIALLPYGYSANPESLEVDFRLTSFPDLKNYV